MKDLSETFGEASTIKTLKLTLNHGKSRRTFDNSGVLFTTEKVLIRIPSVINRFFRECYFFSNKIPKNPERRKWNDLKFTWDFMYPSYTFKFFDVIIGDLHRN